MEIKFFIYFYCAKRKYRTVSCVLNILNAENLKPYFNCKARSITLQDRPASGHNVSPLFSVLRQV